MTNKCKLRFGQDDFDCLMTHLFPGDGDEHGAVLLAGQAELDGQLVLTIREIHLAREGIDYVAGEVGYRALSPKFIHRLITRARDERLVYLAVHNHASDREVSFSRVDLDSHSRGYPALLQIARGMPVGALVFGRRSIQADIWLPQGSSLNLDEAVVVGNTIKRLTPSPTYISMGGSPDTYDRQIRMFGRGGQVELRSCRVGVIGLGGIGSLVAEYLARLGVGTFYLVDEDRVEESNLSRIVGAGHQDALDRVQKVYVAERNILQAQPTATVHLIADDVAKFSVAKQLAGCDYLFLAADSMRARLVVNALVHQYLVPGVQLGAKVRVDGAGAIADIMSTNRPLRPGKGCLWCNQLIDQNQLAKEAKTDAERIAQAYGTEEPNPSVITLNAVSAAHAVNDFLLDYLGLRQGNGDLHYEHFHHLASARTRVKPRKDETCPECGRSGRFGRGDGLSLPCMEG